MFWSLPGVDGVTIGQVAAQGKSCSSNETALHDRQRGFMKATSRCWHHQQEQPVVFWIQQPGFCAKGFLAWRFLQRGAQVQPCGDPGVEHGNGARAIRLALQTQSQPSQLLRLGTAARWRVDLQPTTNQGTRQWVALSPGCGSTSGSAT